MMDATFRRSQERERAVEAARRLGADTWVIECFLSEEAARRRLEMRFQEGASVSDGRWELYHHQQREWEPVVGGARPPARHVGYGRLPAGHPSGACTPALPTSPVKGPAACLRRITGPRLAISGYT